MVLQARHGILATSWDAIAGRADVATATVYRHFPSLAELLPACADSVFNSTGMPTPDRAAEIFAGAGTPLARLERLVRGTCDCYARGEGWLNAARRERELIPAVRDAVVPATRGRLNDTSKTPMAIAVQIVRARAVNFSSTTREPKPSNEPVRLPITTSSIPMVWGAPFPN